MLYFSSFLRVRWWGWVGVLLWISCSRNTGKVPPSFSPPSGSLYTVTITGPPFLPQEGGSLFVGAKVPNNPVPVLVRRVPPLPFPIQISLRKEDQMVPSPTIPTSMVIFARLDQDGDLSTKEPDDLYGETKSSYPLYTTGISIFLRKGKDLWESFQFSLQIQNLKEISKGGSLFLILFDEEQHQIVAGSVFPFKPPYQFFLPVTSFLLYPQPERSHTVIVKVDRDGDLSTQSKDDLYGSAPFTPKTVTITLSPAPKEGKK